MLQNITEHGSGSGGKVITVSTCDQAGFDTRLAAYTGECGALDLVGCNDQGARCQGPTAVLEIAVTSGVPLLLRVGGAGVSDSGSGTLSLSFTACAPDLDGSGDVGFGDLLQLLSAWGPCTN